MPRGLLNERRIRLDLRRIDPGPLGAVKIIMRVCRMLAPIAACATVLFVAGCGGAGPPPKPAVNLSITAPTSGAVVGVHEIVVAGMVAPGTARVFVDGRLATVVGGRFTRSVRIAQSTETITITGQASGYVPSRASTTVQYSPAQARQLIAARAAQTAATRVTAPGANQSVGQSSAVSAKTLNSVFALSSRSTGSATTHKPTRTHKPAGAAASPIRAPTTTPTRPTAGPQPPSARSPSLTAVEIKQLWLRYCAKGKQHVNLILYCRCIYNHLKRIGALSSRARVLALIKKLQPYERTHDPAKLPLSVRAAILACLAKLPPLGPPVVTRLPGLSHGGVPLPTPPAHP